MSPILTQNIPLRARLLSATPTLALALVMAFSGCSSTPSEPGANQAATGDDSNRQLAGAAQLRPFTEQTLPNGLKVLYVEDKTLPYTSYSLLIKSGSTTDPETLSGLSLLTAELLQKGAAKKTAPQIADALGLIGADFSVSVSPDTTLVSASSLSSKSEELLGLMREIVLQPSFNEAELRRERQNLLAGLEKKIDNPDAFTDTAWEKYLFDKHPYARPVSGTLKSVRGIQKKHIVQHYLKYYRPNNAMLAVVGQYTPELRQKVEQAFGTWARRDLPTLPVGEMSPITGTQIRLVNKPGLVQSQIRIGHKGIRRKNEDFVPLRVANTILGGAFASRLVDKVRKEMGLTYSISSSFDARLDYGPFEISTFTKNETVGLAVGETLKVYKTYVTSGVKSDEVKMAKGYLAGLFPQAIETAEKFAVNLLLLRMYDVPDSYLTTYLAEINKVTVDDVNRVIKKYMQPDNVKVLVYSSAREALPQLLPIGLTEVKEATEFR